MTANLSIVSPNESSAAAVAQTRMKLSMIPNRVENVLLLFLNRLRRMIFVLTLGSEPVSLLTIRSTRVTLPITTSAGSSLIAAAGIILEDERAGMIHPVTHTINVMDTEMRYTSG